MTTGVQGRESNPVMNLRAAESRDTPAITKLLAESGLPISGVGDHLETFVVVETDPGVGTADSEGPSDTVELAGVGGLEIHGRFALLRSLAVEREHRLEGIAARICTQLEAVAAGRGVEQIYLLTETAESFFAIRGYSVVARSAAPAEITATEEFTTLCPDSAVLLVRTC